MNLLFVPIFVHCHECQIRVNPRGTAVLSGGVLHPASPAGLEGLCIAMRLKRREG